jgi:hypothetical protein
MDKSITELRKEASNLQIKDVFKKTRVQLIDEITKKRAPVVKEPVEINVLEIVPDKVEGNEDIKKALEPFEKYGLKIDFYPDHWEMRCAGKSDTGHITMPILDILRCAERLVK